MSGPGRGGLEVAQVTHPVPPQAAVEPGARDLGVQELSHHRKQIVERQQQRLAQRYHNRLLSRGQRGLQPMRRVAPIMDAVALAPFPDRLLGDAVALRHHPGRLGARLDHQPDLRCRRRPPVQRDQHARPLSRTAQERSCEEQHRAARVYVIVRDRTPTRRAAAAPFRSPRPRRHHPGARAAGPGRHPALGWRRDPRSTPASRRSPASAPR